MRTYTLATHYNDVTWASWRLNLPATRLLFNSLFNVNNKEISISTSRTLSKVKSSVDTLHKGPVMREAFPYHDVISWVYHCDVLLYLLCCLVDKVYFVYLHSHKTGLQWDILFIDTDKLSINSNIILLAAFTTFCLVSDTSTSLRVFWVHIFSLMGFT